MLLDTSFLIELANEVRAGRKNGPAHAWLGHNRNMKLWTTVICLGELAPGMRDHAATRFFLGRYRVVNLHPEVAYRAATLDRDLIRRGGRLGENDNWIAGFALYYGSPLLSNDADFDRVPNLRRVSF